MSSSFPVRPLLAVRHLKVELRARGWRAWLPDGDIPKRVIDDLHLDLRPGEVLGIAGEPGCGKTLLAETLAGLRPARGSIRLEGAELRLPQKPPRGRKPHPAIQLVEQVPLAQLKPARRAGEILAAALRTRDPRLDSSQVKAQVAEWLERAELEAEIAELPLKRLSAPQKARLAVLAACLAAPKVLICDAPGAALESSDRSELLLLIDRLANDRGIAVMLLAREPRDLRGHCTRLLIMCLGSIMEQAAPDALLDGYRHPYTRMLLEGDPAIEADNGRRGKTSAGMPVGCVFHPRCPLTDSTCVRSVPNLRRIGHEHYAACHFLSDGEH